MCKARAGMLLGSAASPRNDDRCGKSGTSSGCSLVAGQSTRRPGFPEHRSKWDLCDVARTSLVSLPDSAVLVKQRVAWPLLLDSSNHRICRPKLYLPHFLSLFSPLLSFSLLVS